MSLFKNLFINYFADMNISPKTDINEALDIDANLPVVYVSNNLSNLDFIALRKAILKKNLPWDERINKIFNVDAKDNLALAKEEKKEQASNYYTRNSLQYNDKETINLICVPDHELKSKKKQIRRNNFNLDCNNLMESLANHDTPVQIIFCTVLWGYTDFYPASWWKERGTLGVRFHKKVILQSQLIELDKEMQAYNKQVGLAEDKKKNLVDVLKEFFIQEIATSVESSVIIKTLDRQNIIEEILADPTVQEYVELRVKKKASIDATAETLKKLQTEAQQEAKAMVEEIAANMTVNSLKIYRASLNFLLRHLYKNIEVANLDILSNIRKENKDANIVYVVSHRSHIDYIILSYILTKNDFICPYIAAGQNLDFTLVGNIFRAGGAFFLRRKSNDYLYNVVFKTYFTKIIAKGIDVEFFIEGGRSRTGKLLTGKTGLLGLTKDALLNDSSLNICYVPVWFSYDKVFEVNTYLQEMEGKSKKQESIWLVLSLISKIKLLFSSCGNTYINFGKPVYLRDTLEQEYPSWQAALDNNRIDNRALSKMQGKLLKELMSGINNSAYVSNMSLISNILDTQDTLDVSYVAEMVELLREILLFSPINDKVKVSTETAQTMLEEFVNINCEVELVNKKLVIIDEFKQHFRYYRNNIEHLLILASIAARSITLSLTEADTKELIKSFHNVISLNYYIDFNEEECLERVIKYRNYYLENLESKHFNQDILFIVANISDYFFLHVYAILEAIYQIKDSGKNLIVSIINAQLIKILKELSKHNSINHIDFEYQTNISSLINAFRDSSFFTLDITEISDIKTNLTHWLADKKIEISSYATNLAETPSDEKKDDEKKDDEKKGNDKQAAEAKSDAKKTDDKNDTDILAAEKTEKQKILQK